MVVQDEVRAQRACSTCATIASAKRASSPTTCGSTGSHSEAKAFYAAIMAESFCAHRQGRHEAKKLLDTYNDADPAFGKCVRFC